MCTVSWSSTAEGFSLWFNRDEQRDRASALPPAIQTHPYATTQFIAPTDPQGGGTWIAVNEYGLVVCLLNYYQGDIPQGVLKSRGLIVREMAMCPSLYAASEYLQSQCLDQVAPFTLLLFQHQQQVSYCWSGRNMSTPAIRSPFTSSSVCFDEVHATRMAAAHTQTPGLEYHQYHYRGKADYRSVCMHREDARTVSVTHIHVSHSRATLAYFGDSPCRWDTGSPLYTTLSLPLILS